METEDLGMEPNELHASAVLYLVEGKELEAAEALLYARVERIDVGKPGQWDDTAPVWVLCRGPRKTVEAIMDSHNITYQQIRDAIIACLPSGTFLSDVICKAEIHSPKKDWTAEILDLIGKGGIANQAVGATTTYPWQGFRFRSKVEIRVAQALDKRGVLFFPLPRARMTIGKGRGNTEPDFLVCMNGRWGIMEVDGEPFHPKERSAIEHERDRLFKAHGIRVVERYDANLAYNDTDRVVDGFLKIVSQIG